MRIVYDHQTFTRQRRGGISRYFCELASRLARTTDCEVDVLAPIHLNEHLREYCPSLVWGLYLPELGLGGRARRAANNRISSRWLARRLPDVIHHTYYSDGVAVPIGCRAVQTVHDMMHELFPSHFPPGNRVAMEKAAAVRRADRVICDSHNTRNDLLNAITLEAEKVVVVHLGGPLRYERSEVTQPLLGYPYLLYVGPRYPLKNFDRLVQAVADAPRLHHGLRLVCFGGGPFTTEERRQFARLHIPAAAVVQLGGSDKVLANLYAHAEALVYPSLYEGFGLPPIEAMWLGCPVVCSNAGSLPEVVGAAAEMCDPTDPAAIREAVERVVESRQRSDELRALGADRAMLYSWDNTASRTRDVYRSLLEIRA